MAVAVKNTPEAARSSPLDRLAVVSLAGVVYVLGCLGIVFKLIPSLWWSAWVPAVGAGAYPAVGWTGLIVLLVAAAGVLVVVGARLLGPRAVPGVRAGIFVGLLGALVVLLLTRWASLWIEHWAYDDGKIFGLPFSPAAGALTTAAVGLLFLAVGVRLFTRPKVERFLIRFEGQGWFSGTAYKPLQGQKVRRGTIFGLLLLVGAGIWTLMAHGTLRGGPADWQVTIPFTGRVTVTDPGDVKDELDKRFPGHGEPLVVSRYVLRDLNEKVDPSRHVKVTIRGDSSFKENAIVERSEFDKEVKRLESEDRTPPDGVPPRPATGPTTFETITLLPSVQYTVPLLLLGLAIWLSWRVVNMPNFADFLIATEAELNKVSWTTRRRLVQDTIVVLVTVFLMAVFLFAMDQTWRVILSWKPIGVIRVPEDPTETNTKLEQKNW
jgi:preprotein translocase SecE subunit